MIYLPIDIRSPIKTSDAIQVQFGLTNNFPEVIIELHEGKLYFDIGDEPTVSATVTNTDLETTVFTGPISVLNPHRGQLLVQPVAKDFTMTGINTVTFKIGMESEIISFQITMFVHSISNGILENI